MTDARGKVTQYAYDALDRPTQITYPSGAPTVWEYDGGASPTPATKGERTKLTDGSGQISYAYDAMGRLTTKTQTTNGKTFIVRYTWGDSGSALDKLTAITYPSGSGVNYSYDAQGALSGVSVNPVNANGVGVSATTLGLLSTIGYNADNQFKGWTWQNGTTQSIGYDSFGQIASYDLGDATGTGSAAGSRRTLVRDAAGRIIGFTHTNNATPTPHRPQPGPVLWLRRPEPFAQRQPVGQHHPVPLRRHRQPHQEGGGCNHLHQHHRSSQQPRDAKPRTWRAPLSSSTTRPGTSPTTASTAMPTATAAA